MAEPGQFPANCKKNQRPSADGPPLRVAKFKRHTTGYIEYCAFGVPLSATIRAKTTEIAGREGLGTITIRVKTKPACPCDCSRDKPAVLT